MAATIKQPLYLISDGAELRQKGLLLNRIERALKAAEGEIGIVQLREQSNTGFKATDSELLNLARELKLLCAEYRAQLVINSRSDIAALCGAAGVHLNTKSIGFNDIRNYLGHGALTGYSAHTVTEALEVLDLGLNYVFISPIFQTKSKPGAIGLEPLQELCRRTSKVVYALGGVNSENAADCRSAGASGVALISAILGAVDPEGAARKILDSWYGA